LIRMALLLFLEEGHPFREVTWAPRARACPPGVAQVPGTRARRATCDAASTGRPLRPGDHLRGQRRQPRAVLGRRAAARADSPLLAYRRTAAPRVETPPRRRRLLNTAAEEAGGNNFVDSDTRLAREINSSQKTYFLLPPEVHHACPLTPELETTVEHCTRPSSSGPAQRPPDGYHASVGLAPGCSAVVRSLTSFVFRGVRMPVFARMLVQLRPLAVRNWISP
jgi:hypothetical protein